MSEEIKMAKVTTDPVRIMRVSGNGQSIADLAADVAQLQDDVAGIQTDVGGIQADVTQLQTDVSGVSSTVSGMASDVSDLSADVSDLKSALTELETAAEDIPNKVSKPSTNPDGTSGQVLRTLGNGQTEWASVASPTDEQVENAVTDWLDAHPEATTTVEDFSLTANKLVKGTLGYVIPQQFGAKGDGVTDDTTAVNNAIDYAVDNGYAVFLPEGTYIVNSATLKYYIGNGKSLIIYGAGQNSIIKRKADSLVGKWSQLFTVYVKGSMATHGKDVIFSNFFIDSNRRGQSMATDGYDYEASADIQITNESGEYGGADQYVDKVLIDNMTFFDPVADCFNFSGSGQVFVKNIFINNMIATGRNGTRNDIGFTGNPIGPVYISKCNCGSIHFEYNQNPAESEIIDYFIEDSCFGVFTLGALARLHVDNCKIGDELILCAKEATLNNCEIHLKKDASHYIINGTNFGYYYFNNCRFITYYSLEANASNYIYIRDYVDASFNGCQFDYSGDLDLDLDNDTVNDHVTGCAVKTINGSNCRVAFNSCNVSKVFQFFINFQGGKMKLSNMQMSAYNMFNFHHQNNNTEYRVNFENVYLDSDCKYPFYIETTGSNSNHELNGVIYCLQSNCAFNSANKSQAQGYFARKTGNFRIHALLTAPMSFDLLSTIWAHTAGAGSFATERKVGLHEGDTFEYIGANAALYPNKWVANSTGLTTTKTYNGNGANETPLTLRFKTIGVGTGDTESRPNCYLQSGFQYYDTDLEKMIMWSGSAWVNLDGSALS